MSKPDTSVENLTLDFSAKDPVCGMIVDPPQARGKARYQGETYFFCSPGCMHKFTANPAKYITAEGEPANGTSAAKPAPKKLEKDPVCGMSVDPAGAASSVEHEGKLYHFCSRGCAEKFQRDANQYLFPQAAQNWRGPVTANLDPTHKPAGMPGMVQIGAPVQTGAAPKLEKDPVCGMNVDPANPAAMADHEGKTYYFCCRGCADKFNADPQKYLAPSTTAIAEP